MFCIHPIKGVVMLKQLDPTLERRRIIVQGIVQGVGFRPFVYSKAVRWGLAGFVLNDSRGVTIEVEGNLNALDGFERALREEAPPLARVDSVIAELLPSHGETDFVIVHSQGGSERRALISPDTSTCVDCLRELLDSHDRRYRYPFINCTNCGPRFTIIRDIPYDRPSTSMAMFPMCLACLAEYENPLDRRFHAQPNACWDCGPRVELWDKSGRRIECRHPIVEAVSVLHAGLVVAVKGLGGFHLAVDATNSAAVALLRQ